MRQRPGDQRLPVVNDHPIIQNLVMEDIAVRLEVGIERYGTGLQPHNGRDMLRDAYEEALDLATYLRGRIYERDNPDARGAEAILVEHQRMDAGSCLCGWSELGKSHPGHQVAMLREAGL